MKLFILPFAGGSANYYSDWQLLLNNIELQPIELAGRGKRFIEPLHGDMDEMVIDVFEKIKNDVFTGSYAIFGHSMGALLAFELVHLIKEKGLPLPEHIFFSGRHAPQTKKEDDLVLHKLPDDDFKEEIIKMGGTSDEIFEHPELVELFFPLLRNDIRIVETYVFNEVKRNAINVDFTILNGKEEECSINQIIGWRSLSTKSCEFFSFDGGHFFINESREKVVEVINKKLQISMEKASSEFAYKNL